VKDLAMRTVYRSFDEFGEKAAILGNALDLAEGDSMDLLARMSGYESPAQVETGSPESGGLHSREELMARLQAKRPDVPNQRAGEIIDRLQLPVRETRMEKFPESPNAAPNISA
jgi:hypothetical protein